jgi:hypothetical protein
MKDLLSKLIADFPKISFKLGENFSWSPKDQTVFYTSPISDSKTANWSLLHELGHATLDHNTYSTDIELVKLECDAWEKAKIIGKKYDYEIDEDHIQDCIDTYRDWLHQRSACPNCASHSIQQDSKTYRCFNCGQIWGVTSSRFCRPYRLKKDPNKKSLQTSNPRATS